MCRRTYGITKKSAEESDDGFGNVRPFDVGDDVQLYELYERVVVVGDDADLLEARKRDEKTDACGNGFLDTVGHRLCKMFSIQVLLVYKQCNTAKAVLRNFHRSKERPLLPPGNKGLFFNL